MRRAGILLPIFSLDSEYGIGDFGKSAYKFVDFLKKSKQKIWQILPLGSTSFGDSPYQSFSTFGGNLYFIDLNALCKKGLLKKYEINKCKVEKGTNINYGNLYKSRYDILYTAYKRADIAKENGFEKFCTENEFWLSNYALFMALKHYFLGASWQKWDKDIKFRKPEAVQYYTELFSEQILFYKYMQFLFYTQWKSLLLYANECGISIMGDMPIYVALDSADVWSNSKLFLLDENLSPTYVAGCPPDCFSVDGQLWGNPLYNWVVHKEENYYWWIMRIKQMFTLYNIIRIDHFLAFENFYSIPANDKDAKGGKWVNGPSLDIFIAIKAAIGDMEIIAEDLGLINDNVRALLKNTGFCGMRVLHFGIFAKDDNYHLPHNYIKNSVAYTGTHDNETLLGAFNHQSYSNKKYAMNYLDIKDKKMFVRSCIKEMYKSVSDTIIIPMQDYLELTNKARINTPSTKQNNWQWRIGEYNNKDLISEIKSLVQTYFR